MTYDSGMSFLKFKFDFSTKRKNSIYRKGNSTVDKLTVHTVKGSSKAD